MPLLAVLQPAVNPQPMQQIWTILQNDGPNHLILMPLLALLQLSIDDAPPIPATSEDDDDDGRLWCAPLHGRA